MFVPNFSSSVGRLNPSGVHFIVTLAKMRGCRHYQLRSVCVCCSPKPTLHGRGHCLTTLITVLRSLEVMRAVIVTARGPCTWLNLTLLGQTLRYAGLRVCVFIYIWLLVFILYVLSTIGSVLISSHLLEDLNNMREVCDALLPQF